MNAAPLIETRALTKTYGESGGFFHRGERPPAAVDHVDLKIERGETLGLVGESGSGKSTLGRAILKLLPVDSGSILFDGADITAASKPELRALRRRMQIVFQDPYASLHPRLSVRQTLEDGLRAGATARPAMAARLKELIHAVGLGPAHVDAMPHQLSGGQRQRVAIARALSVNPSFIVADEPVSALDVSIQAQILNLLADLQRDFKLSYLFISHDLNVIRYLADRIAVMYRGRIVETAPAATVLSAPRHPYTRMLLSAMPGAAGDRTAEPARRDAQRADPTQSPKTGCAFYAQCPISDPGCLNASPTLKALAPDHYVACFHPA